MPHILRTILSESDYLQLLDWTAQQAVSGKQGVTPKEITRWTALATLLPVAVQIHRVGQDQNTSQR